MRWIIYLFSVRFFSTLLSLVTSHPSFVHYFSTHKSLYLKQKLICFSILSESHWMVVEVVVVFLLFFPLFLLSLAHLLQRNMWCVACDFLVPSVQSHRTHNSPTHNPMSTVQRIQNNQNVFTDRLQLVFCFFFVVVVSVASLLFIHVSRTKSFSSTLPRFDKSGRWGTLFCACACRFVCIVFGECCAVWM